MKDPKHTKFVTILREPMRQLESSVVYFKYDEVYGFSKKQLTEYFLNSTITDRKRYWNLFLNQHNITLNLKHYLVRNPNAFDLGHTTWVKDEGTVSEIIGAVNKDFDLAMVTDHMLESLVLLKDELCWDLEELLYFSINKRAEQTLQRSTDTARNRDLLRKCNNIDYALFGEFNKTLWERIEAGGDRFRTDVERLRQLNQDFEEKCLERGGVHYDKTIKWFPILTYKLNNDTIGTKYRAMCEKLIRPEIEYNNYLRERQSRKGWKVPIRGDDLMFFYM